MSDVTAVLDVFRRAEVRDYDVVDNDGYNNQQLVALRATSLALGALSVSSAILAFYWFVRMRRNFRHDLIMLLIQSDMFKSLWFAIYPIVSFVRGPIGSDSAFCQVSGFFLTAGIEASDIAVLLIALHTGINIFRPRHNGDELGLFPYRHVAYLVWFVVPMIIAGLAFVRGPHGYVDDGRWCYLPGQPMWPRLALSWIPRFVIFIVIIMTYGYMYYYVSVVVRRYGKLSKSRRGIWRSGTRTLDEAPTPTQPSPSHPPAVPDIQYHGLIPPTPPMRVASLHRPSIESTRPGPSSPRSSISSTSSNESEPRRTTPASQKTKKWRPSQSSNGHSASNQSGGASTDRPEHVCYSSQPLTPLATQDGFLAVPPASHIPCPRRESISTTTLASTQNGTPGSNGLTSDMLPPPTLQRPTRSSSRLSALSYRPTFLSIISRRGRREDLRRAGLSTSASSSRTDLSADPEMGVFLSPSAYDVTGLKKMRERIRRQVRLLLIYPLVYMLLWVPPLIAHVFKWHDDSQTVPFVVSLLSLATLAAQGAINCWLFSTREKPWKHRGGGNGDGRAIANGGVVSRRATRIGPWALPAPLQRGYTSGPGRTRQEMLADGKNAHRRRQKEEMEERRMGAAEKPRERAPVKEWWEVEDEEGENGHDRRDGGGDGSGDEGEDRVGDDSAIGGGDMDDSEGKGKGIGDKDKDIGVKEHRSGV